MICKCCQLRPVAHLSATAWETYVEPEFCRECIEHQGDLARKAGDHESLLRARLADVLQSRQEARNKASEYLGQMNEMRRRERRMLEMLSLIAYEHQRDTVRGCRCGDANCETQKALGSPWLSEPLIHYESQQEAIRRRGGQAG